MSRLRKAWSRLTDFFDFSLPSLSFDGISPLDRQLFVSISSKAQDAEHWIEIFRGRMSPRWNLMSQNDFRPWTDDIDPHCWWEQFPRTRASYAMLVLTEPEEGTSQGQDAEIEDAIGRGIPIAVCRTSDLRSTALNRMFATQLSAHPQPKPDPWSCVEHFDFYERDTNQELARLETWVDRFAVPPLALPLDLVAGELYPFRATIRVPHENGWSPVDWQQFSPLLVFNYGLLFLAPTSILRSKTCDQKGQIVIPLRSTNIPGEITADIVLPSKGFGNAVITVGQPRENYAGPLGGLVAAAPDLVLWWDFHVQESRNPADSTERVSSLFT